MTSKQSSMGTLRTTHWWILSCIFTLIATLLLFNGCGSGKMMGTNTMMPPQGPTSSFAFVSNSGSGTVSSFAVSTSGSLSLVSGAPFAAGAGAEFMAFDSVHKLLFVSNQGANSVSAFSVNTSTGMLSAVPGSPFATGGRPTGVAVDAMGRFVFVGNQNDSSVSVFTISGTTGALTPVAGSPFTGIASPFGLAVNPTGAFLFVNNFTDGGGGANSVSTLQIGSTGTLTLVSGPLATSSPNGMSAPIGLATDGKFLFVANHMAESVVPFSINAGSGALTSTSPLPAPPAMCGTSCHNNPLRLAVDPMDKFVYWTNVQAGTVVSFNINNGSPSFVSQATTGQHPFGLAFDPGGNFLFVANKTDSTVSAFSVNSSTGVISPVAGSPFTGGGLNQPTDIVVVAKQ